MSRPKALSSREEQDVCSKYLSGSTTVHNLSHEYSVSAPTIYNVLRRNNITVSSKAKRLTLAQGEARRKQILNSVQKNNDMPIDQRLSTIIQTVYGGFEHRYISGISSIKKSIISDINQNNNQKLKLGSWPFDFQMGQTCERSRSSKWGSAFHKLAPEICKTILSSEEEMLTTIEGPIYKAQLYKVSDLIQMYRNGKVPSSSDYQCLRHSGYKQDGASEDHYKSDICILDHKNKRCNIFELKSSTQLDNLKSQSEKTTLLHKFAIMSNTLPSSWAIDIHLGIVMDEEINNGKKLFRFVHQFFAEDEILNQQEFWNWITKSNDGYNTIEKLADDHMQKMVSNIRRENKNAISTINREMARGKI